MFCWKRRQPDEQRKNYWTCTGKRTSRKRLKKMKKLQHEAFKVFGSKRVLPLEQIEKLHENLEY